MEAGDCLFGGKKYTIGEQVCEKDKCYICRDGAWDERFEDCVFGVGP